MSTVEQSLRLYDGMSGPLKNINQVLHLVVDSFEAMQSASGRAVDTTSLQSARRGLERIDAEFQRMEESAEGVRRAQERLNHSFDEGTTAASRMGRMLKAGVAAVLSAKTVGAITDWLRESMDLSDIQRNAEMQLKTVMQNVGMTQEAFEELKRTASGIQGKGIYGDEAMLGGAAEFATYLSDPKAIEKMMGTLSNYAMGMSGGGALDYNQMVDYATQLGKALNGSYDGLLKKGFTLTDQQKEIIENGTDMQKALVLDEVIAESWDGLYEAMSNTPQGKIIQLQNSIGDLREEVGERVYPMVARIAQSISDHFDTIKTLVEVFAKTIQIVLYAAGSVIDWFGSLLDKLRDNWENLKIPIFAVGAAIAAVTVVAGGGIGAIIALVVALIGYIYSVASSIAKTTGVAKTGFGVIAGAVNVVIQLVVNLAKFLAGGLVKGFVAVETVGKNAFIAIGNLAQGLWSSLKAIAANIGIAFENGFHKALGAAADFAAGAYEKLLGLANLINKVLGIFGFQIDTSGLERLVSNIYTLSNAEKSKIQSYEDVSAAFKEGFSTYQYASPSGEAAKVGNWSSFETGWAQNAFNNGANWGDQKIDQLQNAVSGILNYGQNAPDEWLSRTLNGIKDGVDSIAEDSSDISKEYLKLLREMAERQAINQFTTAEVKVEMTNNNQINSEQDLDGIVRYLEETLEESMYAVAEGVHV